MVNIFNFLSGLFLLRFAVVISIELETIVCHHEEEREGKAGNVGLAEFSLAISEDPAFDIFEFESISFGFLELDVLFHVLPEVALYVLKQYEF